MTDQAHVSTLVLIPSLGADAGIYQPQRAYFGERLVVTPWIAPLSREESIDSYGRRLGEIIPTLPGVRKPYWVGGLSFGGMIAAAVGEAYREDTAGVLLMAACTSADQILPLFRTAAMAGQVVPNGLVKGALNHLIPFLWGGLEALPPDSQEAFWDTWYRGSAELMKWGARAMARWEPGATPRSPTFSAHGRLDPVIPIREKSLRPGIDLVIPDGMHLINLSHPGPINRWIEKTMNRPL